MVRIIGKIGLVILTAFYILCKLLTPRRQALAHYCLDCGHIVSYYRCWFCWQRLEGEQPAAPRVN